MNDDEIDFSKVKKFFKKEKPSENKHTESSYNSQQDSISNEDTPNIEVQKETPKVETINEPNTEKSDDEINIDFSKVKKWFKKKDKHIDTSQRTENLEENDEISFDFSKVKNFFKSNKDKSQDKDSVEFDKGLSFLKNHSKTIILLLLVLTPFLVSVYLRATPSSLPITQDWATQTVYNNIQQQITNDIRSQYPNLPQANINNLVHQEFTKILNENKAQIDIQISQVAEQFKSRLQKDGQTYLLAIDPYFWMRHADNVINNGHPGDELRDINTRQTCTDKSDTCVPWDTHMYAPLGRPVPEDMFHAYFTAHFHNFLSIFNPNRDLMSSAFLTPILLASLCVIPAFFIARRLGGNFGGFIAALFVAIHPAFLTRTAGGFADTDAYNVLFPLLITWLFLEAFETRSWKLSISLSVVSGFLVSLYITAWGTGWWYIFDFLLISVIGFIIIYALIHRDNIKNLFKQNTIKHSLVVLFVLFFSSMIFSIGIGGLDMFRLAFDGPMDFINLKEVGIDTVWPNVFTTVAEQNSASLNSVVSQIGMGSLVLFLLAVLGITLTLIKKNSKDIKDLYYFLASLLWLIIIMAIKPQNLLLFIFLISVPILVKILLAIYTKDTKIDFKIAIILIIWFNATIFASTKGVRFLLLLVPAFSLGIGIAFGIIYKQMVSFVSKNLYLKKALASFLIGLLLLLFLVKPFNASQSISKNEIPSMSDAWYESLDKINRESQPDAIINSWWDFGHWFKSAGKRAVTFDGTSQNTPMAHWIGHSLLTNNEEKAIGILRMLDCGSNNAFNELDKEIKDTARSVYILHEVVAMNKKEASDYLQEFVDKTTTDKVIENTHCEPPENFYITSDDMIGKSGVWGHFGSWDFNRALIYNTLKKQGLEKDKPASIDFMKQRFNFSEQSAEQLYFEVKGIRNSDEANRWIAPWPSYASPVTGCTNQNNDVICPVTAQGVNGALTMIINLENGTADITAPGNPVAHPNYMAYPTKNGIKKVSYSNNTIGYSVLLIPNGNSWSYIMSVPPLEDSMFSRLFFHDGHGLDYFEKFSDLTSVTGNRIVVWKVDWEGKQENILPQFIEQPPIAENNSMQ